MNQVEIPEVDQKAAGLPDGKNDILADNRVDKQQETAAQTEIPEGGRYEAAAVLFRIEPLDEKAHEKKGLAGKSQYEQRRLRIRHGLP